jgi:hypothetical protein
MDHAHDDHPRSNHLEDGSIVAIDEVTVFCT